MTKPDRVALEARFASGQPTKHLDDRPDILSNALPYWEAFHVLSGQRDLGGMGAASPIRREAVTDWLNEGGWSEPTDRERFRFYVDTLDGEYLSLAADRQKAEMDKATPRVRSR